MVALLTESVDWNFATAKLPGGYIASLSSRRAWIEIGTKILTVWRKKVALLTESVDWNSLLEMVDIRVICRSPHGERGLKLPFWLLNTPSIASLSSRRAWIEIVTFCKLSGSFDSRSPHGERGLKFLTKNHPLRVCSVALLTESVDWNIDCCSWWRFKICRSPHGERGLKLTYCELTMISLRRSPHGERGLKSYTPMLSGQMMQCRSPHGERGLKFGIGSSDSPNI